MSWNSGSCITGSDTCPSWCVHKESEQPHQHASECISRDGTFMELVRDWGSDVTTVTLMDTMDGGAHFELRYNSLVNLATEAMNMAA